MAYDIILGREESDKLKYGTEGTVLLGKHYVKMGQETTLAQNVHLDINKSHVVFVCGKRGSGKSYSLAVIAEGIKNLQPEMSSKISVVLLDTMGIYWSMKYPNNKEANLLKEWDLKPSAIDVVIYTPLGFFNDYKKKKIPTDKPFSIKPSELSPEDWWMAFELASNDPIAIFIERIILELKDEKEDFDIKEILKSIKDSSEERYIKQAAENRFVSAERWGLFSKEATPIKDLVKGGQITILDMSPYAVMPNGWKIKSLAIGLICQRLFIERMIVRKEEEFSDIHSAIHYISEKDEKPSEMPIVWLALDEAHELIPLDGKTSATGPLITLLREGRQPGISLVLATQQPGKIHTDAMTQSDVILAHRLTARVDTDALGSLMQSYLRKNLDQELSDLPRVSGACLAIDDVNERIYPMRVRPRFSWHGGGAPSILAKKKKWLF